MGEHKVGAITGEQDLAAFTRRALRDLRALEVMIESGALESGVRRIGAEQEMFLVDAQMYPAPVAMEVLRAAHDPRLTTEIASFNLEGNLSPLELDQDCFSRLHAEIDTLIEIVRSAAHAVGAEVVLTGILPTLRKTDLRLANLTPSPRYKAMNEAITNLRGGDFSIHIKGLDELHATHDNMMMESCNTSFQVHLQVGIDEFVRMYNLAQAITAPVLAAAVNSPLLLGHRLWQETRVALFQHAVDARSVAQQARSQPTRVGFGTDWLKSNAIEVFREDLARFRPLLTIDSDEDPMQVLAAGRAPDLRALRLHNGTVWRWNRPCYGIVDGKAHLRIENRALPAGPTVLDEVANAALFVGLMYALPAEYGAIDKLMSFDDAKANFFAAARHGLGAQFTWVGGNSSAVSALLLDHLLPLARQGLTSANVLGSDIDRYLGVVEERVRSGRTGAQWMGDSLARLRKVHSLDTAQRAIVSATVEHQKGGDPVSRWPLCTESSDDDWRTSFATVGQFMSTDLFTLRPDDLIDLVASVMDWRHIRHVPVEDEQGKLVGLVSHRSLLRILARGGAAEAAAGQATASTIMRTNLITVSPLTTTLAAIEIMRANKIGCLPVVEGGKLVGIVTAQDFLAVSARLFEAHFGVKP